MLLLVLLVFPFCSSTGPAYVYNGSNIQLQRVVIVPSFHGDTLLTMSCDEVRSVAFCGPELKFFCSGFLSNANMSTEMGIFITDENAVTQLDKDPIWNITTACQGNVVNLGGEVILSNVVNHVTFYEKLYQWVDYCGTFNITMFYVQTTTENQVYPTEIVYQNYTQYIHDNCTNFECPNEGKLAGGSIFLIIGCSFLCLVVLLVLLFLWAKAYGHPILKLCRMTKGDVDEAENPYTDISTKEEITLPVEKKQISEREEQTRSKTANSLDSGVFSLRPSLMSIDPRESLSFPSRKTSFVENQIYLQENSLPLRRPSRLSIGSLLLEEAQGQKRGSNHGYDFPSEPTADKVERTRRYLPRKSSNQSDRRERINSLNSILKT